MIGQQTKQHGRVISPTSSGVSDMSNVIQMKPKRIEDQPHFSIPSRVGVHVIAVQTVRDMADGKIELIKEGQEDEDKALLEQIIREWLEITG